MELHANGFKKRGTVPDWGRGGFFMHVSNKAEFTSLYGGKV